MTVSSYCRSFASPKKETGSSQKPAKLSLDSFGEPTADSALIDAVFPSVQSGWDHNSVEGKERLKVYSQTLLAALKEVVRQMTNMSKVYDVRQNLRGTLQPSWNACRKS